MSLFVLKPHSWIAETGIMELRDSTYVMNADLS